MNVANLELCKELYELSGWVTNDFWQWVEAHQEYELNNGDSMNEQHPEYPAYDLGYLLRKLPPRQDPDFGDEVMYYPGVHMIGEVIHKTHAIAGYWDIEGRLWGDWSEVADTPEDAACKLAIELFKNGGLS